MLGTMKGRHGIPFRRDPQQADHWRHRNAECAHVCVSVVASHDAELGLVRERQPSHTRPGDHKAEPAVDVQLLDLDAYRVAGDHPVDRDRSRRRVDAASVEQLADLVGARDRAGAAVMRLDEEGFSLADFRHR